MGVWMGTWIVGSGILGFYNAKEPGNYCRIGSFLGFCLVSVISIFVCVVVLGASVIKHYEFEAKVVRDYYRDILHDNHEDYNKPDKYFKERNEAGQRGLALYSPLIAVLSLDFLNCVASCFVSRALWKKEEVDSRQHYRIQRQQNRLHPLQRYQQVIGQSPFQQPFLVSFAPVQRSTAAFQVITADNMLQDYHMPKLPSYLDVCPEGPQGEAQLREQYEPHIPSDPPPAYSATAEVVPTVTMDIGSRTEENSNSEIPNENSADEGPFREDCQPQNTRERNDEPANRVTASVIIVEPATHSERNTASDDETSSPNAVQNQDSENELSASS